MYGDDELFAFLPSHRKEVLAQALSRRLETVQRFFALSPEQFVEDARFRREDYFSLNSGPVQFTFAGDVHHVLDVWGEQLSVVVLDDALTENAFGTLYTLSTAATAPTELRDCLGRECLDVRIWTLREEIESSEAREVAVSYVLAGAAELFYCIYLHDDLDSDYLLLGPQVPRQKVDRCYSIVRDEYIGPRE